jgi:hypothetical protein
MLFISWPQNPQPASPSRRVHQKIRRAAFQRAAARSRPRLELLEDRTLLSGVSFSTPASYPVGLVPFAIATGDLNGDGKPDLVVPNQSSNTVSVLLGKGDGTFQTAMNFAGAGAPRSVAIGDFNGDGKPDLVVPNVNGGNIVLLGNGDGTFRAGQTFATNGGGYSVVAGDFNGDHKLDIAVATANDLSVLLGNGDGTFQSPQSYLAGQLEPFSVAEGDFNGDGKPDLAVADLQGGTVGVLLGNGDGTFQTTQYTAPCFKLVIGDFNGDHKLDIVTANYSANSVSVLLGNGDGTFQAAQTFAIGVDAEYAVAGDFNGDGKLDLAVPNTSENTVSVLLGNGDGSFQAAHSFDVGLDPWSDAVGDFNGDGKLDLAVANAGGNSVGVLLNQLVTTTAVSGPTSSTYAQSVTYTASVTSGNTPVAGGTITFLDGDTPLSPALPVDTHGKASFSFASLNVGSHTITASYASGSPGGAGITGFGASTGTASLMINPVALSASGVKSTATAGALFTGTVATFTNVDPYGSAASYRAIITWSDGSTSNGTITGSGTLTVQGSHTYVDPGKDAVRVQISHVLGNTTTATALSTTTVVSLGQSVQSGLTGDIGFWHGKTGQALINGFNGGLGASALSGWLATTFPNLYGAGAGSNDLAGQFNSKVAAFFKTQSALPGSNVEAQVLATALNVYATTLSLGGTIAQAYGFTVSVDGLGADSFNVGADGTAFGVAKKTTLNVYELLEAVDRQTVLGVLYNGDPTLQKTSNHLLHVLNTAGSIS